MRITFLGAGSGFAPTLAKDIFQTPGLDSGEFCMVDLDPKRLALSVKATEMTNEQLGKNWKVIGATDRKKVLKGSNYLINCIEVSGVATVKHDYEIPLKYGVDQCIGDTIGPGGIMKALRTVPAWLQILQDAEKYCPDALVLNYTNPMTIMTLAGLRSSKMRLVGLCHSVQGSSKQLASYIGIPYDEMKWRCAGINHMAWFTELTHKGKDMYPVLKKKVREDKALYEKDPVRFEMMLYFDYFVTESSGHFSEYVPYFRKRSELIDKFCRESYLGGRGFYSKNWPQWRQNLDARRRRIIEGKEKFDLNRSHEYASQIIESREFNKPSIINGSVLNTGLIENLPQNEVVEVPCLVDKNGITPTWFGPLPPQVAALCRSNMAVYEVVVNGILNNCYQSVLYGMMLDPLTAAVCSPDEIKKMFDELIAAEKDYIPKLK